MSAAPSEPPEALATLIARLYDANQRRDLAAFSAVTHTDLEWPDLTRGGWLKGPAAVRDYWAYNDAALRVEVTPVEARLLPDGRIMVDVNQVVWNHAGQLWSDIRVRHCYTLRDGLIWRMDVLLSESGEADQGP